MTQRARSTRLISRDRRAGQRRSRGLARPRRWLSFPAAGENPHRVTALVNAVQVLILADRRHVGRAQYA